MPAGSSSSRDDRLPAARRRLDDTDRQVGRLSIRLAQIAAVGQSAHRAIVDGQLPRDQERPVRAVTHRCHDLAVGSRATERGDRELAHVTRVTVGRPASHAAVCADVPADDLKVPTAVADCRDHIRRIERDERNLVDLTGLRVFVVEPGHGPV
jgi:hypothetical protein